MCSFAVGMFFASENLAERTPDPKSRSALAIMLNAPFTITCFGALLSGPVVLLSHFFRGRRKWLTIGEWLWILPLLMHVSILVSTEKLAVICVLVPLLWLFSITAFLLLCFDHQRTDFRGCRWADRFGACTCLLTGWWILLRFYLYPGWL